jgi:hydrogen peroxide-dependent heme synthase
MTQQALPALPLTIEGSSVLHQMMRIRWSAWRALDRTTRSQITDEARAILQNMEAGEANGSALYSMLGHKGDLMFVHFRRNFDDLNAAELSLAKTRLWDYLEPITSYLSMVELGLYESTVKLYKQLVGDGLQPNTPEWNDKVNDTLNRQREAMAPRLFPPIPPAKYICFYPMDRKRGEHKNWYTLPIEERNRQMQEHGEVGRRYAGVVKQIITGSIGFDDWEWGVDLFADDPLVFKKLIYEMRFDEVSAVYALFGQFYVGIRVPADQLGNLLTADHH